MEIRGATREQIIEALETANSAYNGNLRFGHSLGYGYSDIEPLNNRGNAFKVKVGVESSRRPGSRVSPERYFYGTDVNKPRRIASPCWHANRDFMRALFALAPDARIRTALTNSDEFATASEYFGYGRKRQYTGSEHFEDLYRETDNNVGNQVSYTPHSDACNCDEGYYTEFATEGLTPEQYDARMDIWRDYPDSYVKAPKRDKAIIGKPKEGVSA